MRDSRLKVVAIALSMLVLVLAGGWLYLRSSLPNNSGAVSLAGLDGR